MTVLITDMEGSTELTDAQGDESAMHMLHIHERIARDRIAAHGGREIKSMGDGFMVAFTDATRAVACALDLQAELARHNADHPEQCLRVRMGLNAGPVIEEGGDLYGTTVNATSRIAAKARSGHVLVSEAVREIAGDDDWAFVDRGLFWLKGLRERWRLFEATREPDTHVVPGSPQGRTPFVDREDERAAMRLYVDSVLGGRGGLALLTGEPGCGKTRLVEELGYEAAGRGARFVVGRCYEASRGHPFAPFIEVLDAVRREVSPLEYRMFLGETAGEIARIMPDIRRRYPDIPPPADLPPEQERHYLFSSVRDVLTAISLHRPLLVLLDDLHWADEPSLLFLEQLADDLASLPVLIVGTFIQVPVGGAQTLNTTVEKLVRRRVLERFQIGPLGESDVGSMLAVFGNTQPPDELVRLIHRTTEGNPFFVEEVARHLAEQGLLFDDRGEWSDVSSLSLDVPETVRLTIGRRLDLLSDDTRRLLTIGAIVGRDFGFELLESLVETSEDKLLDALDEAERARIIGSTAHAGGIRFHFEHELFRQTLVRDVSLARRQIMHLRVADATERVYETTIRDQASDVAYHLVEAGRRAAPDRTVRFLVLAGDRALEAAAHEEALRDFDRALSLVPAGDLAGRAPVLEKLAMAERSLGQLEDARSTWDEALDAYHEIGDVESEARLCLDAGVQVSWWTGRADVLALIERGLQALEGRDTSVRAGLIGLAGVMSSHGGRYYQAEEQLNQAIEIARRHDDDRILGTVLYAKAAHHFNYVEQERAVAYGRESVAYLERAGDLWNLANALGFVGQALGFLGRFDEAAEVTEGAKALAERLGNWVAYIYIDRARSWRHIAPNPNADELERSGRRDVERGRRLGYGWMCSAGLTRVSLASFVRGDWSEALSWAEESASFERGFGEGHLGRLVLLHAYLGDREKTIETFDRLEHRFPRVGEPAYVGVLDSCLAAMEGMALIGETDRIAHLYPLTLETVAKGLVFRGWDYRLIHSCAGIAAACSRRWDEAEEHLSSALKIADELPYRLEQPEARRWYAWMLVQRDRSDDRARAKALLEEAIGMYNAIGMRAHQALARSMIDQIA